MEFLKILLKSLFILATILLMVVPFALEFYTFRRDKEKKISYKRLRILIYTAVYVIAITIALYLVKELTLWLEKLTFVVWLAAKLALSNRQVYFAKVLVAVLVNCAIGVLYGIFSKFVRIGLKKKNLAQPQKKDGEFTWRQKLERKLIKFFHTETWFFAGNILKYLSIVLSVVYILVFVAYEMPALFGAKWIPYNFISLLFSAGYIYPSITLLALWEMYFFLEGIKRLEEECPELLKEEEEILGTAGKVDLQAIDEEVRNQFKNFYACDVDLSKALQEEVATADHHEITKLIAQAVESDQRNPQKSKERYLQCVDKLVENDKSVLINGEFFSEFSMYFLRYLSAVVARGDNVVFVCNSDTQIEEVYQYLKKGLSELSSLYCKEFQTGAVNFDDPIWRIVKIHGETDALEEAAVDDNSILVTSLSYLCSTHFESEHSKFIHLLDTVVFVDAQKTVNNYNRQLAMLNARLKHITKNNAQLSKNGNVNQGFRVRYMSKQVRYICFDDTRTPGLDKVLKNLLAVDLVSVDAMHYNPGTLVRCYHYEGRPDENGRRVCPQFLDAEEQIGALMNMAVLCLAKGASNVTVFADDLIPTANLEESIAANMGRVCIKADGSNIRLNKPFYNPDDYSVMIVMDSGDNLPAVIRKHMSMVSDKPALIIVFSRPYMMRDYYIENVDTLWSNTQIERIPVEEGTKKDVAQLILVKANAGGISEEEILRLASSVSQFEPFVQERDINSILRAILEIQGIPQEERIDLFQYFEYTSSQDFDENGVYSSENRVLLRKQGKLFDMINGRDMVILATHDQEIVLPLPRSRLTQNYIVDQNLLYNGNIYHIRKIDTATGRVHARLAVGGKNEEAYQYIQAREYHVELPERDEMVFPPKHVVLRRKDADVSVNDVYVSVFRAPMEVVTKGYFEVDPYTLAVNAGDNEYYSISDPGNDERAKQTYRRYGTVATPTYSSDTIIKSTDLNANSQGALMMSIRICGQFGPDTNKTMTLAAVMLNELLRSMFPSAADSVVVCPVLNSQPTDAESVAVLQKQPRVTVKGASQFVSNTDFNLLIIEDCATDLGVVSVLMSAGDDLMNTLFQPIFRYLKWYMAAGAKSDYLYYGLDHEPACFDFASLHSLSKIFGDDRHDLRFVDIETVLEYAVCDFCGQRHAKGEGIIELDDGRKMCKTCAENLVGNNQKLLKLHLERARMYLESTYGIQLDDDYEFCFESTVKIVNTLKQNRNLVKRGSNAPLKSYVDDKKKVHVEYSLPSANLSELLVRELTHVWQLKHLPDVEEELAEGHIALVGIQYLRFLNQHSLASVRATHYESSNAICGEGYRKLVRELLANPQYRNNPFRYLLEHKGGTKEEKIVPPKPAQLEDGDLGLRYTPQQPDRVLNGPPAYFYYNRLTATEQAAYDKMVEGVREHKDRITINGISFESIKRVFHSVLYDRPELFWFRSVAQKGPDVFLYYGASKEECDVLQRRIDEVVPKYLEAIDDSMSAYDVALRIHTKLITEVDYDTVALNKESKEGDPPVEEIDYLRSICGVFLNRKAVCAGYARAVQYLLQKCGVECAYASGLVRRENGEQGGGHAWNILKVDGDYYYMDSTWDDSSDTIQKVKMTDIGFSYFCITTEEISRSRGFERCPVDMPNCIATRANFYYHNDLVVEAYDLERVKTIARNAAKNKRKFFTFKCTSKAVHERMLSGVCGWGEDCTAVLKAAAKEDKKISTVHCNNTYDPKLLTITIKFCYD